MGNGFGPSFPDCWDKNVPTADVLWQGYANNLGPQVTVVAGDCWHTPPHLLPPLLLPPHPLPHLPAAHSALHTTLHTALSSGRRYFQHSMGSNSWRNNWMKIIFPFYQLQIFKIRNCPYSFLPSWVQSQALAPTERILVLFPTWGSLFLGQPPKEPGR